MAQFRVLPGIRADQAWPAAWLIAEYLGKDFHGYATDLDRDSERALRLQEYGVQTLPLTSALLRRPERTRGQIQAVVDQRLNQCAGRPPMQPVR